MGQMMTSVKEAIAAINGLRVCEVSIEVAPPGAFSFESDGKPFPYEISFGCIVRRTILPMIPTHEHILLAGCVNAEPIGPYKAGTVLIERAHYKEPISVAIRSHPWNHKLNSKGVWERVVDGGGNPRFPEAVFP